MCSAANVGTGHRGRQGAEHARLVEKLRLGAAVPDPRFDQLYPEELRRLSAIHWTPIEVARQAVGLLPSEVEAEILDVGAGAGKLCILGALLSRSSFVGVEQREELVEAARAAARGLGAGRARFIQGSAFDLDWSQYQGLYLYNPFGELLDPNPEEYQRHVAEAVARLARMPAGTRVVVYHGLGAQMPAGYRRAFSGWAGTGRLEAWERLTDRRGRRPASGPRTSLRARAARCPRR